jgi:ribosome biogenesis GTPase
MDLRILGAGDDLAGAFQPYREHGLVAARVAAANRDIYRLLGEEEWTAEAAGVLWNRGVAPVVGDWVAARPVAAGQAIVEAVLPRHSLFARRAPGSRHERQAIAANIDLAFLVCGLDGDFNPRRLERYRALTAESGAQAIVILNKTDCAADLPAAVRTAQETAGVPVVPLSARESVEPLRPLLREGQTVVLLGSSGVGKSTIANGLLGEDRLRTAAVRPSDSRGRHTTTHRELFVLPGGGILIDTPGMREVQLWASEEAVESAFAEIGAMAAACRFRDCSHTGEAGCAVAGAVDAARLSSYRKLVAEARYHAATDDPLAAAERKRHWKSLHKAARRLYREREDRRR